MATIKDALASGVTFFDTAEVYNVGKTVDNNEQLLGGLHRAAWVGWGIRCLAAGVCC